MARGEEVDRRIHEAALELLRSRGPAAVTVEAVAAESGVARTTIYRRHRDRDEVLESALKEIAATNLLTPTEDVWADMRQAIELLIATFQQNQGVGVFLGLITGGDPELVELIRAKLLRPRIELGIMRMRAGVATGQIRPDADVETAADLVLGAVAARFAHAGTFPQEWIDSVVDLVRSALEVR
ncbi:TetR/AcrR family transcriptional regulator C-terminal ligand-binding domain-containing protein [Ruania alkalisoli]|uniref:TetR/AcrR family transcriptional regulator C-terminal ligand-binding domain-containing protein n=1 Tax=Ruania alkalisoli TaxID=2779775 RepID=A0A7M1STL4_9MICO|nr:TetR-like C-terminal domain-containing protein [Ruania alkalisoli]QOR70919.1 TetR/AcrR family transcriptional regulator C-terminal ligand-binding domain-containing protein [Ruania alkalisoli]